MTNELAGRVTGWAYLLGPVSGATVEVRPLGDNLAEQPPVASGTTSNKGAFDLAVPAGTSKAPLLLVVRGPTPRTRTAAPRRSSTTTTS